MFIMLSFTAKRRLRFQIWKRISAGSLENMVKDVRVLGGAEGAILRRGCMMLFAKNGSV